MIYDLAFLGCLAGIVLIFACCPRGRHNELRDGLRPVRRGPDRGVHNVQSRLSPPAPTGLVLTESCDRSGDDTVESSGRGDKGSPSSPHVTVAPAGPIDPEDYGIPPVVLGPEGPTPYLRRSRRPR